MEDEDDEEMVSAACGEVDVDAEAVLSAALAEVSAAAVVVSAGGVTAVLFFILSLTELFLPDAMNAASSSSLYRCAFSSAVSTPVGTPVEKWRIELCREVETVKMTEGWRAWWVVRSGGCWLASWRRN